MSAAASGDDYPIELTPPDISPYRAGNTGVDYFTTFDSGRPGPHVGVTAVVHGNELCGAIALDLLFRQGVRPARGKLTLGFVNVDAFHSFDREFPAASRYVDEDFNRLWAVEVLEGERDSAELRRARAVRPVIDQIDLLLDIHSMQHATAPLMMAGPLAKGRALAAAVGIPEIVVSDAGHAAGKRMRDYTGYADPASPRNALLVECGQHWEARSADVAVECAFRFLRHTGTVDADTAAPFIPDAVPPAQKFIEVTGPITIETDDFSFTQPFRGLEVIAEAGTVIGHDGDRPVATPFDDCVLIMPSRRLRRGESAVRLGRFIGPD
ncbi:MAG: succinylglutamate desuccinylase/aspartoacylase family protein [Hyphomicrobiales bacterium]|nr:succinylglutamate desuccinylase/aspartoacylase family protein [Hyphomicrobiales bacterium]MCP5372418.1 succinylglutamate desuccinylase/aspartoacylase family protein [Hyphomicrobiales bacterium]